MTVNFKKSNEPCQSSRKMKMTGIDTWRDRKLEYFYNKEIESIIETLFPWKTTQTKQDKIKPKTLQAQITLLVSLLIHLRSTSLRNNTNPSQTFREQK